MKSGWPKQQTQQEETDKNEKKRKESVIHQNECQMGNNAPIKVVGS
jgi:hypothetical protein